MATIINLNDTTPTAPAGKKNVKWQGDTSDPRNVSAYVDDVSPQLVLRAFYGIRYPGNGTAVPAAIGTFTPNFASSVTTQKNGDANNPSMISVTTNSGATQQGYGVEDGNVGSIAEGTGSTLPQLSLFRCKARLDQTTTGTRAWIGLLDTQHAAAIQNPGSMASNLPNFNYVAFRFSAGTDTHWQAICATGSGAVTAVNTGIAPDTSNAQQFEITYDGTNVNFYINGSLVASISTNVPGNTVILHEVCTIDNQNTNNAVSLSFAYMYLYYL